MNNKLLFAFLGLVLVVSSAFLFVGRNKPTEEALTVANIQNQSEIVAPVMLSSSIQSSEADKSESQMDDTTGGSQNNATPKNS